jgi:hypothetical protein
MGLDRGRLERRHRVHTRLKLLPRRVRKA